MAYCTKKKSKWFLIANIVPVHVRAGILFEVDLQVQAAVAFSSNAGINKIFLNYGYEYDGNSWNALGTNYNYDISPYFNYGFSLTGSENDECISAGLSIIPHIKLSFALYETLEVQLQLALIKSVGSEYPYSCNSNIEACNLQYPQIGTSTSLKFEVDVIPQINLLGAPVLSETISILSLFVYNIDAVCNDFFLSDAYYGCCGEPETRFPTKSPVKSPTFHPTPLSLAINYYQTISSYDEQLIGGTLYLFKYQVSYDIFMSGVIRYDDGSFNIRTSKIDNINSNDSSRRLLSSYTPINGRYYAECGSSEALYLLEITSQGALVYAGCQSSSNSIQFEHKDCSWNTPSTGTFSYSCDANDAILTGFSWTTSDPSSNSVKCCTIQRKN